MVFNSEFGFGFLANSDGIVDSLVSLTDNSFSFVKEIGGDEIVSSSKSGGLYLEGVLNFYFDFDFEDYLDSENLPISGFGFSDFDFEKLGVSCYSVAIGSAISNLTSTIGSWSTGTLCIIN